VARAVIPVTAAKAADLVVIREHLAPAAVAAVVVD
jgi:hypothetical protein